MFIYWLALLSLLKVKSLEIKSKLKQKCSDRINKVRRGGRMEEKGGRKKREDLIKIELFLLLICKLGLFTAPVETW